MKDTCPICGAPHDIDDIYCPTCSWEFRLFPNNSPAEILEIEERRIDKYKETYVHTINLEKDLSATNKVIVDKENAIKQLVDKVSELSSSLSSLKDEKTALEEQLKEANSDQKKRLLEQAKQNEIALSQLKEEKEGIIAMHSKEMEKAKKDIEEAEKKCEDMLAFVKPKIVQYQEAIKYWKGKYESTIKQK